MIILGRKHYLLAAMILASLGIVTPSAQSDVLAPEPSAINVQGLLKPDAMAPVKPPLPDYNEVVLKPLHQAQVRQAEAIAKIKTACKTTGGTFDGVSCVPPPVVSSVQATPASDPTASVVAEFVGTIGYSSPDGNCVDEVGVNNPGWGDPIDWPATSQSPWVGASALFFFNHVAVVTGVWDNGDIEVRQQNCPGCQHRYPKNEIRGFR